MLSNLVSMLTKSLTNVNTPAISQVQAKSNNPFATNNNNPFLSTTFSSNSYYGKNQPVSGGYFAGYYNGKPNIVGRKLFIEV